MRLILDTNQIDHVARTPPTNAFSPTFVVPPLVWVEIVRSDRAVERATALSKHDLLFGADIVYFLSSLSLMSEVMVRRAIPVYSPLQQSHEELYAGFLNPTDKYRERALTIKSEADQTAADVIDRAKRESAEHHKMRSRGEKPEFVKWTTIEDAEATLYPDVDARWAQETLSMVTCNDEYDIACESKATLWDAILSNHHLRLWMRVAITQFFGYRQCWTEDKLNTQPQGNDITDITVPLYARPGDVILTAEKKLKRSIQHSDPNNTVRVMTWNEYLLWHDNGYE